MTEEGQYSGKGRWGDPRVPKRGWTCVHMDDLGEPSQVCEMCDTVMIRYVHTMSHPDYGSELECGCVCAGHMEGSETAARERETGIRNEAARRRKWPDLKGWRMSKAGNLTILKEGCRVTVYRKQDVYRVSAGRDGAEPKFGRKSYPTEDAAIRASFDAFLWARRQERQ